MDADERQIQKARELASRMRTHRSSASAAAPEAIPRKLQELSERPPGLPTDEEVAELLEKAASRLEETIARERELERWGQQLHLLDEALQALKAQESGGGKPLELLAKTVVFIPQAQQALAFGAKRDGDTEVRRLLKNLFRRYHDALSEALRSGDDVAKGAAVRTLGQFCQRLDDPRVASLLYQALHHKAIMEVAGIALVRSPFFDRYRIVHDGPHCVCTEDFHRLARYQVKLPKRDGNDAEIPLRSFEWWACRFCHGVLHQQGVTKVVAAIDGMLERPSALADGVLVVNWLEHRSLFDFDEVRIGDVDSDVVEEFVMLVRNDTDSRRRSRYGSTLVFIAPNHRLSQAKLNLLKGTFRGTSFSG